jgi:hypothetical protein
MRTTSSTSVVTLIAVLTVAGCSGEPEAAPSNIEEFTEPQCASPDELCLPEPEQGFQIRTEGTEIGPGEDVEYCEVVLLPGSEDDVYYVRAFESQMTAGSHHLIVAGIEPGTATDENAEVGDRVPCTGPDVFGGELQAVTGAQLPYAHESFPEGVGRKFHGGQKIVFDYHYFNASSAPIAANAAVNFHTTDESAVKKISRSFGFYNIGIEIPPGAEKSFTRECTFTHDVYVHKLTRHTHQWGTEFNTWYVGGERDGEMVFSSPDYETVDFPFEDPVLIRAGEGFRFECGFINTESYPLEFGLKASDEMCILFGNWYAANEGEEVPQQGCLVL